MQNYGNVCSNVKTLKFCKHTVFISILALLSAKAKNETFIISFQTIQQQVNKLIKEIMNIALKKVENQHTTMAQWTFDIAAANMCGEEKLFLHLMQISVAIQK